MIQGWPEYKHSKPLRERIKQIKPARTWQILIVAVVCGVLGAVFLRTNSQNMADLRAAVIEADRSGDQTQVEQSAQKLQHYVGQHMNTSTGRIGLSHSYDAALQQAWLTINPSLNPDGYAVAAETCKSQVAAGGYASYAQCISTSVSDNANLQLPALPNPALYYLDFAAPEFSFDLAGVCLTLCLLLLTLAIWRVATLLTLRWILHRRRHKILKSS
jgi:hypothetical protein